MTQESTTYTKVEDGKQTASATVPAGGDHSAAWTALVGAKS